MNGWSDTLRLAVLVALVLAPLAFVAGVLFAVVVP